MSQKGDKLKWATIIAAFIGAALMVTPSVHAQPGSPEMVHDASVFCMALEDDNSPQGVLAARDWVMEGIPVEWAKATLVYAIDNVCPEQVPAIQRFINYYGLAPNSGPVAPPSVPDAPQLNRAI